MADEGTASAIFPPPPPFYKHFTPANLERAKEWKDAQTGQKEGEASGTSSLLDLPPELRYLLPPEPPADGIYRSFGKLVDVCSLL
jgi:mediator of RNA polymerase II transcription subunit 7